MSKKMLWPLSLENLVNTTAKGCNASDHSIIHYNISKYHSCEFLEKQNVKTEENKHGSLTTSK